MPQVERVKPDDANGQGIFTGIFGTFLWVTEISFIINSSLTGPLKLEQCAPNLIQWTNTTNLDFGLRTIAMIKLR